MLDVTNITETQLLESALAVPAFLPVMFCPGYLAAWFTNLHGFRSHTLVERVFWSIPLSLAVSAIASMLIGRFLSLAAVVAFLLACSILWVATIAWEWRSLRSHGMTWRIGWRPLGGKAAALAAIWVAIVLFSLVDIQRGQRLFLNDVMLDHGIRVHWIETILHSGVPPVNPLYLYGHPATMRNYYFWYVICAAIAEMTHLSARAVMTASSAWAGLALISLNGLYIKHFLRVGSHLREQFIRSILLLTVSGFGIGVALWNLFHAHILPDPELDFWSLDPIFSWLNNLLWAPHHVAGLICCMLAFLLTWLAATGNIRTQIVAVVLSAAAIASAAGLSAYVTFAFSLVMIPWALGHMVTVRKARPVLLLAAAGAGATLLIIPYLRDLTQGSSGVHSAPFAFAIRGMISPDALMKWSPLSRLYQESPTVALSLARLVMLVPGYTLEFGFYIAIFALYLIPALRGRQKLNLERRTLLFIALVTLLLITFLRSGVLKSNDFGWRGGLLIQFALLMLASDALTGWSQIYRDHETLSTTGQGLRTPSWLRSFASLALVVGVFSTLAQAVMLRGVALTEGPPAESVPGQALRDVPQNFSHNAYISRIGYAQLDAAIPHSAVVQFNPMIHEALWTAIDELGVDHQVAIVGDRPWCGAEVGGDPSGCAGMASAIDALYSGQSADAARATCHVLGIQYLIARVYDPVWQQRNSWVWTLPSVVADNEFRALDCR